MSGHCEPCRAKGGKAWQSPRTEVGPAESPFEVGPSPLGLGDVGERVLQEDLPSTADVVIIGGGVMGASTAYHLALAGWKDIVLLERGELLGQGATGRCAGGVRYQFATEVNIRLSLASLPMIERLLEETGVDPLYPPCGGWVSGW